MSGRLVLKTGLDAGVTFKAFRKNEFIPNIAALTCFPSVQTTTRSLQIGTHYTVA